MQKRPTLVYVDLAAEPHFAGRLWTQARKGKETASFEYDVEWLKNKLRFSLEPMLRLAEGVYHTGPKKALFGAIGDSAPDRWGRVLMRRAQRQAVQVGKSPNRTLTELDYLLGVSDFARQGALRFKTEPNGDFLAAGTEAIPPLVNLPKLLAATEHYLKDSENYEELKLILAPGSSLGGARPKASVIDPKGHLYIAKFSHPEDEYLNTAWEAVALQLAQAAGISVPEWYFKRIKGRSVLLLKRFDRSGRKRIPFLSAMSMLDARDDEEHSYLELVDAIHRQGAAPKKDMAELWRRMLFNVLISNTDDHLRNHGFLHQGLSGWCLSPAYDLNPTPVEIKPRILTTCITLDDATASLDLVMEVSEEFGLSYETAKEIAKEVAHAVSQWQAYASALGIRPREVDRMSSAFEHQDFYKAQ